jgi:hypothetical protein
MGLAMRETGKRTCNMGRVKRHGLMDLSMKAHISKARNMALVSTVGTMAHAMKACGLRTKSEGLALTPGLMAVCTKVSGLITTWKAWEYIPGQMVDVMRVNTEMIRSMDMGSTPGPIEGNTKECGTKGNSMVLESTKFQIVMLGMDSGKMEKG